MATALKRHGRIRLHSRVRVRGRGLCTGFEGLEGEVLGPSLHRAFHSVVKLDNTGEVKVFNNSDLQVIK